MESYGPLPKVVFTTSVLHHPPIGGPFLRIENSIKALSRISDLYVFSRIPVSKIGGAPAADFYGRFTRGLWFPKRSARRLLSRVANKVCWTISKKSPFLSDPNSVDLSLEILQQAENIGADVIWLGYGNISYPLLEHLKKRSSIKVVVDTDSVWSRFVLRRLPFARDEAEREKIRREGLQKEEEERKGASLADVTTAVSQVDADYYRPLAREPRHVHLFSNVIDLENYRLLPPPPASLKKPCLYLAGSFGPRSPMEDAARWVLENVLPSLQKAIPDLQFIIAGSGSDTTLADVQCPSVTVTGKVPSTLSYLCHADVALVPLRFESGTRFKILEAGACGTPVISTTLGAEGLEVIHGKHLLLADTPEDFIQAVLRLLHDRVLASTLSSNLRRLVEEKYSLNALVQEGRQILSHLGFAPPESGNKEGLAS